ncbi:hypothetical protein BGX27_007478 [Mortierella sp. AM989]|nr:hypothetical protein BGX27_007478 [Mortierella sp. AM989]
MSRIITSISLAILIHYSSSIRSMGPMDPNIPESLMGKGSWLRRQYLKRAADFASEASPIPLEQRTALRQAMRSHTSALGEGSSGAQHALGYYHEEGISVAMDCYQKAAANGNKDAKARLTDQNEFERDKLRNSMRRKFNQVA